MNKKTLPEIREEFHANVTATLPEDDNIYECILPAPILSKEDGEDCFELGAFLSAYLKERKIEAGFTCLRPMSSYPQLIILTHAGSSQKAVEILLDAGGRAFMPYPNLEDISLLHRVRDKDTGQEGVLFRTGMRNVIAFAKKHGFQPAQSGFEAAPA